MKPSEITASDGFGSYWYITNKKERMIAELVFYAEWAACLDGAKRKPTCRLLREFL